MTAGSCVPQTLTKRHKSKENVGLGTTVGEPVDESTRASCIPVGTLGIWKRSKGSALSVCQVTLSSRSHDGGGGGTSLEAKHPGLEQPWKHLIPFARVFFTMDSAGTMNIALKSCLDDAFHRDIQLSLIAAVTSISEDGSEPRRGKRTVSRFS